MRRSSGCTTPVSWFAAWIDTPGAPAPAASASPPSSTRPWASTGNAAWVHARTLGCSTAAAHQSGVASASARALASVAPLVNTTQLGGQPTSAATRPRACSTFACAARPSAWADIGFAGDAHTSPISARTSAAGGVVAA